MVRVQNSCIARMPCISSTWWQRANCPGVLGGCALEKWRLALNASVWRYREWQKFPLKSYFPSQSWDLCRNFHQAIHSRFWRSSFLFPVLMLSRWAQWPDLKWRASTVWSHPPLLPLAGEEEELWNRIITSSLLALELQTVHHVANGLKSLAELPLGAQEASYPRRRWHRRISCSLFIVQPNRPGRCHRQPGDVVSRNNVKSR